MNHNKSYRKLGRTVFQGSKVLEYTKSTVRGDKFVYTTNF